MMIWTDELLAIVIRMAERNPGALSVLRDLMDAGRDDLIARLDLLEIYGPRIYMLWNDVCGRNLDRMALLLEAHAAGDVEREAIYRAIDSCGQNIADNKFLEKIRHNHETNQTNTMKTETETTKGRLTAARAEEIFHACLFQEGEPTDNHVEAEGVMIRVGFHPDRLQAHKEEIISLLHQLPDEFHQEKGGGWSFLNACMTRDGEQWGEHRNIDELLMLGIAAGAAKVMMPRAMWNILPGGMPYFAVLS